MKNENLKVWSAVVFGFGLATAVSLYAQAMASLASVAGSQAVQAPVPQAIVTPFLPGATHGG